MNGVNPVFFKTGRITIRSQACGSVFRAFRGQVRGGAPGIVMAEKTGGLPKIQGKPPAWCVVSRRSSAAGIQGIYLMTTSIKTRASLEGAPSLSSTV